MQSHRKENERARGCGKQNGKDIEENMRRRKDGEETQNSLN